MLPAILFSSLLVVACILVVLVMYRLLRHTRITLAQFTVLCLVSIITLGLIMLTLRGAHWVAALLATLLPIILRFGPLLARLPGQWRGHTVGRGSGNTSRAQTRFLDMQLDLASGEMRGQVIRGALAGRPLDTLDYTECRQLWQEVAADSDSVAVLQAWLERTHPDWHIHDEDPGYAEDGTGDNDTTDNTSNGPTASAMSHREALDILGLQEGADRAAIIAAHRRLMQTAHPDRGGSAWVAARLNEAKDLLLRDRNR